MKGSGAATAHAVVVGAGWFPVALGGMLVVSSGGPTASGLPPGVQGALIAILVMAALPVAWPVYIALGWYEAGLASSIRRGDDGARDRLRRLLMAQGLVAACAGAVVAACAAGLRASDVDGHLVWAWLPLALAAVAHLATARRLRPF